MSDTPSGCQKALVELIRSSMTRGAWWNAPLLLPTSVFGLLFCGLQRIVFTARKPVRSLHNAEETDGQRRRILKKRGLLASFKR